MHPKRVLIPFLIFIIVFAVSTFAFTISSVGTSPAMRDPKSMLVQSGVAYDAKETLWGEIKVQDPKSFFKPTTDQITWWGQFKPFKFWGTPELKAHWIAPPPPGREVARQDFKGSHCVLAKSTLKMEAVAQPVPEGKWRVDIYHKGQLIDSKNFMIYGGPTKGSIQVSQLPGDAVQVS